MSQTVHPEETAYSVPPAALHHNPRPTSAAPSPADNQQPETHPASEPPAGPSNGTGATDTEATDTEATDTGATDTGATDTSDADSTAVGGDTPDPADHADNALEDIPDDFDPQPVPSESTLDDEDLPDDLDPPADSGDAPESQDDADRSRAVTQPLTAFDPDDPDEPDEPDLADASTGHDPAGSSQRGQTDELAPVEFPDSFPDQDDETQMLDSSKAPAIHPHRSIQGLTAAARRDMGRVRQTNQDSVLCLLTTLPRGDLDIPMGLFIVADGMGGHDGGETASRIAIRTVLHEVLAQLVMPVLDNSDFDAIQPIMISAVQQANQDIWSHAQQVGSDMGTTCTAVLLLGQALYIAHVGDSRAYLREVSGLRALTADHSTVGRLIELGELEPAAARNHPLRNQLYRTIGQQPQVEVDFVYQHLANSSHLVICSDGLWGMISEEQIDEVLITSPWAQDVCDELIALANLAGGEDNISAIVVTLPVGERLDV